MLIYYSATSLPGTAMTEVLGGAGSHYLSSRELRREVRAILNPADDDDRAGRLDQKARAERAVAKHGGMGPPKSGSL